MAIGAIYNGAGAISLKRCPFCGGKATLKRLSNGLKSCPNTTIIDEWKVECNNKCCYTQNFNDVIFHADNGEVVVEHNGAAEAAAAWNTRKEK